MKNIKNLVFSGLVICLISCSAGTNITSSASGGKFNEDLSSFRPSYTLEDKNPEQKEEIDEPNVPFAPSRDVTVSLDRKLVQLKEKAPASARGFRVQVYSGNSSDEARKTKENVESLICDESVYIDYRIPNFRVRVGNAISRIEANHILSRVKSEYPNAMVVPENEMEIKLKDCN